MTRACIHLDIHNHPISDGICRETLDTISSLIAKEVSKTPTAKNSAIAMAASKEFLDKYVIHSGPRPKKMLRARNWRTSWTSLST
jgi:ATP-dependent protease Clp ATPase subunit